MSEDSNDEISSEDIAEKKIKDFVDQLDDEEFYYYLLKHVSNRVLVISWYTIEDIQLIVDNYFDDNYTITEQIFKEMMEEVRLRNFIDKTSKVICEWLSKRYNWNYNGLYKNKQYKYLQ